MTTTPELKGTVSASLEGAAQHVAQIRGVTLGASHPALAGNGLTTKTPTFCEYVSVARPVLLTLQHYLPTWYAWVVDILVSVMDRVCPPPPTV